MAACSPAVPRRREPRTAERNRAPPDEAPQLTSAVWSAAPTSPWLVWAVLDADEIVA
jgi:hypothetical protein